MAIGGKNTEASENAESQTEQRDSKPKDEKKAVQSKNISRLLKYAAATLSFISFLTTANGLVAVVGEANRWQAYLISFGIQAIVLILGTEFLRVWEIIVESVGRCLLRKYIRTRLKNKGTIDAE